MSAMNFVALMFLVPFRIMACLLTLVCDVFTMLMGKEKRRSRRR